MSDKVKFYKLTMGRNFKFIFFFGLFACGAPVGVPDVDVTGRIGLSFFVLLVLVTKTNTSGN